MKLAANLSWLYTEYPFPDRLNACAEDGFKYAECMFPYDYPATLLNQKAREAGVKWVLINAPAGDWNAGDRGLAADLKRRDAFKRSIAGAVEYAQAMDVRKVHVLAGVVNLLNAEAESRAWACYRQNLAWLAEQTRDLDIQWLIEPINRSDMPGYLLAEQACAHTLIMELNKPNLGVQMDLYHCQKQEGNALQALAKYLPTGRVGHLQIAGVPDRNEPGHRNAANPDECGVEPILDYRDVHAELVRLNYNGTIGCEYRPTATTRDGLDWIPKTGFSGTMEAF